MNQHLPGYNSVLTDQLTLLHHILQKNKVLYQIIEQAHHLRLKSYYIGAGCIAQTVWNYQNGNDLMYGISDVDLAYYDDTDVSYEAEDGLIRRASTIFKNSTVQLDIKNQARVHLWYQDFFGYAVEPYSSVENAINSWPTTATSAGVRITDSDFMVYAPFGLNDL